MILILSRFPKETPCPRVPVLRSLVTRVVEFACVAMKAGRTECPFVANSRTGTFWKTLDPCASHNSDWASAPFDRRRNAISFENSKIHRRA